MKTLLFTILVCVAFQQGIAALKASDAGVGMSSRKVQLEVAMSDIRR